MPHQLPGEKDGTARVVEGKGKPRQELYRTILFRE
jgi:hypothetical protein